MRTFFFGFLFFLLYALAARWYFVCEVRQLCGEAQLPAAPALQLVEGDSVWLDGFEQFSFPEGGLAPELTPNNDEFLRSTAAILREYPEKHLAITGHLLKSEEGRPAGIYENFGIARAAAVEGLFEIMAIPEERISLDYRVVEGESLLQPLSFELYTPQPEPDAYARLQFRFEDMTFSDANFEYNSAVFKPGDAFIAYADSVRAFLEAHPDYVLVITGHTDSIASSEYNHQLGLERARSAAEYFRELGVEAPIEVQSRGESEPVAPNTRPDGSDNPEGRQRNRRVNFRLQPKAEPPS
ncbi:MAG: OmpA family protein [Bacteroidetes bacterium]|nr:MAG: OmpA family protein [Bacteroidota bacterium]